MTSQLTNFPVNLFEKYDEYTPHDSSTTQNKLLSPEQKAILEKAMNITFVNPKFKMEHFVTSGQITPYSAIKQWVLELKSHEESTENYEHTINKIDLEIEILELKLEQTVDQIDQKLIEIELLDKRKQNKQNKRRLKQLYIEREQFVELIQEFLARPESKTPDGRSLLDIFETPEEEEYEKQYWSVRLARQAAMDISSYGKISHGNLDAICQLPPEMQNQTLALAHEVSLKIESANDYIRNETHKHLLANDKEYKDNISSNNKATPKISLTEYKEGNINDVYRS
jgi:hypothetical protein